MIKCRSILHNTISLLEAMLRKVELLAHLWSNGPRVSPWSRISRISHGALQPQKRTFNENKIIYCVLRTDILLRTLSKQELYYDVLQSYGV